MSLCLLGASLLSPMWRETATRFLQVCAFPVMNAFGALPLWMALYLLGPLLLSPVLEGDSNQVFLGLRLSWLEHMCVCACPGHFN